MSIPNLPFTEWDLSLKNFDVILGHLWFHRFNPIIDWRYHKILSINGSDIQDETSTNNEGWIIKVTTIMEAQENIPPAIKTLLMKYKDAFPNELPDTLPPRRGIEFELTMRPDAKPQYRPPFGLSQVDKHLWTSVAVK
ncbi:hypothetical protein LEN26_016365 [Aphanomyces euteiches]|nr:hypothetical protein LEN26_016365 [Aphanomyces euteiches]KAH9103837.1 hypothetical protein AeMF1_019927 [Aphanomyces euteiches]KAH9185712.1 hypothetical protein AeNC1_012310 [Aphanomyces euteiches]